MRDNLTRACVRDAVVAAAAAMTSRRRHQYHANRLAVMNASEMTHFVSSETQNLNSINRTQQNVARCVQAYRTSASVSGSLHVVSVDPCY